MAKKNNNPKDDSLSGWFHINKHRLTEKQKEYLDIMLDPKTRVVFLLGPSGTTKTWLATYAALRLYSEDADRKMKTLYIRSLAESSERSIGSLPGQVGEKYAPFTQPFLDKLYEMLDEKDVSYLKNQEAFEGMPINFVRGQDWKNKIAILDEIQNFSKSELTTAMTRISENTKMYLCGDTMQKDVRNSAIDLFSEAFDSEELREEGIYVLKFTTEDILRDGIVKVIIEVIENMSSR